MDFNIVSKNNLGTVIALLLVVILSQAKFFNFLLDTALGRAILITFIIIISYMNKILGVVSVLFIIIIFNNSDIGYMEGFTSNNKPMNMNGQMNMTGPMNNPAAPAAPAGKMMAPPSKMMAPPSKMMPPPSKMMAPAGKMNTTNDAAEGFDIIGTESTIKRGKPSNTIPATKSVGVENFAPFSGSYSDSYSSF
jgi:hypothetical protein